MQFFDAATTYVTADMHFDHANIIKFCNRPYANVEEMNEGLFKNFNAKVKPTDSLIILGDLTFSRKPGRFEEICRRLNGKKYLIRGNHDEQAEGFEYKGQALGCEWIKDYAEIRTMLPGVGKKDIILFHYAMRVWNKSHHGSWLLWGHSHGDLPDLKDTIMSPYSFDIGVDCHNMQPLSLLEVAEIMAKKAPVAMDQLHHGAKAT